MEKIILSFLFVTSFLTSFSQCDNYRIEMSDAETNAEDAYDYCKKAYNSSTIEDFLYYARKAKSSADDTVDNGSNAQSYASNCGCDEGQNYASDVESYADDAYRNIKKAMNEEKLEDAKYYMKKAMRKAENAEDEASSGLTVCDS